MRINKKNKKEKNFVSRLISFFFLLIIIFLIVFLIISNFKMFQRRTSLKVHLQEKQEELVDLSRQDDQENEPFYSQEYNLERIIREQLLMKKEGEEVVSITFSEGLTESQEIQEQEIIWWNPFSWFK